MKKLASRAACTLIVSLPWLALTAQTTQDVRQKVEALEQQVQSHLQQQNPKLAIPLLREIVSLDPKNLNAQGNLGVLLYFQDNYTEAIPHMRIALQLQPDLWRIEALLGIAAKRTGDPREAQGHLERAFPNLTDPSIRMQTGLVLIELYSASGYLEKALSVATKLLESAPENPQILYVTHQISRQLMNQSLLSMMMVAPNSAEMHMIMAGELGRQGNQTAAIEEYREAIRLNPVLPGAHFELAEQLRTSSDSALNAQAEDEYKAAIKVNQNDEKSWIQLGRILAARGDFEAAETHYRKALALRPDNADAQTGLAIALISMNQTDEAISLLESAVKNDPTNTVAHYRLSGLYRRAGRTEDAQRELEAFTHYKEVGETLEKIFKQLAGAVQ